MAAIIPIPALTDNYIWLVREGRNAAVIDPGDAAPVLAHLEREGLALTGIAITHHHWDHVNGIAALVEQFPVPVYGPAREAIPGRTHPVAEGDVFTLGGTGVELSVLDVPGHTAGQVAYVGTCDGHPITFTGDTLFTCGCGRLFEGTPAQMVDSLAKLAALPGDTRVYCGHEYTLANLRFARAVEPGNPALDERQAREQAKRDRERADCSVANGRGACDEPVPARGGAGRIRRGAGARGPAARRRGRCLRGAAGVEECLSLGATGRSSSRPVPGCPRVDAR